MQHNDKQEPQLTGPRVLQQRTHPRVARSTRPLFDDIITESEGAHKLISNAHMFGWMSNPLTYASMLFALTTSQMASALNTCPPSAQTCSPIRVELNREQR